MMGSAVVKASPERNLYCIWSTVVDAPTVIGTRAEMAAWLYDYYSPHDIRLRGEEAARTEIGHRLAHCDKTGCSARFRTEFDWGNEEIIYKGQHTLTRDRLADLLDHYLNEPDHNEDEDPTCGGILTAINYDD